MSSPSPAAATSTSASPATSTSTSAPTSASASPNTTPSSASASASTPSKPKLNVAAKPWTPGNVTTIPVTHPAMPMPIPIPMPIPVSGQPIIAPIHVNPNHHHTTSITTAPLSAVLSSPAAAATAASIPPNATTSASKPKLRASASAFVPGSFAKPTTPPSTTSSPAAVAAKPNGVAHASPATTATATPAPTAAAATATTPATTTPAAAAATTTSTPATSATSATTTPTPAAATTPAPSTAATPATSSASTTTSSPATSTATATSTTTSEDESRRKDSTASTSTSTPTLSASKKSPALNPLIPKVDLPVVRARKPAAQRVRQAKVNDDDGDRDVTRDRSGSHVNADGDEEPIETTEKKEVISGFVPPAEGDHRRYDREFLMTFKDICLDPPPGLPDQIEGILRAASERRGSSAGMGADWRGATRAPSKLDGSLGPQNRFGMLRPGAGGDSSRFPSSSSSSFRSTETRRQPSSGSSSIRPSSSQRGSATDIRRAPASQPPLVTGPVEPLAKSENRYQVMKDIPQDVKLLRNLNSILNKLTPEKFDLLVEKVMELDISTAALLRDCVTAVFEKALAEPNFSPTYAEFCVRLSERLPAFNSDENDTKKSTNFKRLILNRCQQEFEDEADHSETMAKLPNDEEKELFRMKMKRRTLGTIRFIGELFARSMLQAAIMKQCLVKLLGDVNAPVEEDIEALCKLLDTVGHLLDKDKHKDFLDLLYTNMKTLSTSKLLSSRIRFMLQDSIELRAKGWVARRKTEQAKKISDIRTEVKPTITVSEVTKIAPLRPANRFDQFSSGSSIRPGASRFDRYSIKKEPASSPKRNKNSTGTDDWATVGSAKKWTGGRTPQGPLSPEKNSHQRQSSQAKSKETEPVKPRGNAFDMLGDEDDHDQNDADEHEHDDENNHDEKSSTTTSTSTSTSTTVLSEDQLKSKVQSLLKEFFSVYDMNEATTCITELGSINIHHGVVLEGLLLMIEGKDKDREWFSKLLIHLYKEKIITRQHITKAFDEMITLTEDISIDIPKTLEHLATVLSALIAADVIPLNYLNEAPLDTLNPGEGARLAILILQSLRKSRGDDDVVSIFKDAHLKLVSWLKDTQTVDAAKKLLNDKKLDVLVDHVSA